MDKKIVMFPPSVKVPERLRSIVSEIILKIFSDGGKASKVVADELLDRGIEDNGDIYDISLAVFETLESDKFRIVEIPEDSLTTACELSGSISEAIRSARLLCKKMRKNEKRGKKIDEL